MPATKKTAPVKTAGVKRSYPAPTGYTRQGWTARWAAAETNRLNQAHWAGVTDSPISNRIAAQLSTLRARACHEADENPMVDGVIFTHTVDIVGRDGPTYQCQSSSPAYNDWLEAHWRRWFRAPTPNPRVSGASVLRLWVQSLWKKGEVLMQKVTAPRVDSPVSMRIQLIDPRRLNSPLSETGNPRFFMGIEINAQGEPIRYHIQRAADPYHLLSSLGVPDRIPAEDILHVFLTREEDQYRGVPWLAPSLPSIAELRDYDDEVAQAAHQAANLGVYWYPDHPDAPYREIDAVTPVERGTQSVGPPGHKPAMCIPQQPSTQYKEYREEKHGELGRPVGMPTMVVRLDAGRHNYSSARFDGQNYHRAAQTIQTMISGSPQNVGALSELVDDVAREAALSERAAGKRPPTRPPDVEHSFTWPVPPHVDAEKEANATKTRLESGTLTYQDALASHGKTLDETIAARQRADEKLNAAGLPPVPTVMARGASFASRAELRGAASPDSDDDLDSDLIDEAADGEPTRETEEEVDAR